MYRYPARMGNIFEAAMAPASKVFSAIWQKTGVDDTLKNLAISPKQADGIKSAVVFGGLGAVSLGIGMIPTRLAWGFRILGLVSMGYGIYRVIKGWGGGEDASLQNEIKATARALAAQMQPFIAWVENTSPSALEPKSFHDLDTFVTTYALAANDWTIHDLGVRGAAILDLYEWYEPEHMYMHKEWLKYNVTEV